MKTASKKLNREKSFYSQLSSLERQLIKHILSPLELSALRHNYQPFSYKCEGTFIYISAIASKHLLEGAKTQMSFFMNRIEIERKCKNVPRRLREVFEDPLQILSLPPYVRNNLCRLECYNILRVMILGRDYFLNRKEFGKKSMNQIDSLFRKHGCENLFQ